VDQDYFPIWRIRSLSDPPQSAEFVLADTFVCQSMAKPASVGWWPGVDACARRIHGVSGQGLLGTAETRLNWVSAAMGIADVVRTV